ncbi:unnamed protein product [Urochloa humidicola]
MKWHPDKCAGAGSSAGGADAAKARFQKIQGAYAGRRRDPRRYSRRHEPERACRERQGGEPGGHAAAVRGALPAAVAVVLLPAGRRREVGVQETGCTEVVGCRRLADEMLNHCARSVCVMMGEGVKPHAAIWDKSYYYYYYSTEYDGAHYYFTEPEDSDLMS